MRGRHHAEAGTRDHSRLSAAVVDHGSAKFGDDASAELAASLDLVLIRDHQAADSFHPIGPTRWLDVAHWLVLSVALFGHTSAGLGGDRSAELADNADSGTSG